MYVFIYIYIIFIYKDKQKNNKKQKWGIFSRRELDPYGEICGDGE